MVFEDFFKSQEIVWDSKGIHAALKVIIISPDVVTSDPLVPVLKVQDKKVKASTITTREEALADQPGNMFEMRIS